MVTTRGRANATENQGSAAGAESSASPASSKWTKYALWALAVPVLVFVVLFVADTAAYAFEYRPLPTEVVHDHVAVHILRAYRWSGEIVAAVYCEIAEIVQRVFGHVLDAASNSLRIVLPVFMPLIDIAHGFYTYVKTYSDLATFYWRTVTITFATVTTGMLVFSGVHLNRLRKTVGAPAA